MCAEARRIVERERRQLVRGIEVRDQLDLSDIQELRVRLICLDGQLGAVRADMLRRIDRLIARGELDRPGFETLAGQVLALPAPARSRAAA